MLFAALVLLGVAIGVPLGIYGRWAGWGFGLGWWGRPTPVRVVKETPLTGAVMRGGAPWAVTEAAHRVALDVELPDGRRASSITWLRPGASLVGKTVVARVSRTRPGRVHVPRDAAEAPEPEGRY